MYDTCWNLPPFHPPIEKDHEKLNDIQSNEV